MVDVKLLDRRHRETLIIRNRHQREFGKGCVQLTRLWKIESSVQCRDRSGREVDRQRVVQHINVKM